MEWLWSQWPQVEEQICRGGHTLLLLDYDGTLTPVAPEPQQAKLSSATKSLLRRLSRSSKVTVALISGRALADITRLVGLRNLIYVGNHGLEIQLDGQRRVIVVPETCQAAISLVKPRVAKLVTDVPGAHLEDKGLSVGLHYRLVHENQVADLRAAFRREVLPFVRTGALSLLNGKKVIEVRPSVNWTKGHAALWLVKRMRRRSLTPIYIGDDRTDEDAFRLLRDGITIRVGPHRGSRAGYYVRGVREVHSLLQWMSAACA